MKESETRYYQRMLRRSQRKRLAELLPERPPNTFYWAPEDMPSVFRMRGSQQKLEESAHLIFLAVDIEEARRDVPEKALAAG